MIFINNKMVDLSGSAPEFKSVVAEYNQTISDLKERFARYVTIQSRRRPKLNATGLLEPVSPSTIPLYITTVGKTGREEWLYCESIPEIKDGIVVPDTRSKIVLNGELTIDLDDNPDFAFFLIAKHGMLKSGKFYVVDEEKAEREKANSRKKETVLTNAIYGENSQLNIDLTFLRLVAKRWGIANADDKGMESLQNELYDIVNKGDKNKGRGIKEFLEDIKNEDSKVSLEVSSDVRDAIDKKVLVFDEVNNRWQINYQDGSYKVVTTVTIADRPRKEEVLILTMQNDNHMFALLKSALGSPKREVKSTIDEEAVKTTDEISLLRSYAKSLGINTFQQSKEALRAQVLEKISVEAEQ